MLKEKERLTREIKEAKTLLDVKIAEYELEYKKHMEDYQPPTMDEMIDKHTYAKENSHHENDESDGDNDSTHWILNRNMLEDDG